MKCLVLAAGYATRLYPLTENFPKPLLEVNGKSILDWLLEDIDQKIEITQYIIVTNHKFAKHFQAWKETCKLSHDIVILDDGSTANENRLGAVKDIAWAIDSLQVDEDLMVLAGDNLLDFSLASFAQYFQEKQATCVMRHYEPAIEKLQRTGVAEIDDTDKILSMEEKPAEPKSHWAIPPFYIYSKTDLGRIAEGLADGCSADAPGGLITWLCNHGTVYAFEMPGKRFDIGTLQNYEDIQKQYNK